MKRFLQLLCALAFCLALTPATALAADGAPDELYVGDQQVIFAETVTYWTTTDSGGLTRADNSDWNVRYDPDTATLTLSDAVIKTTHNNSPGAVIYAESRSNSAVSLTIQLEGDNKIECDSALYGIYVNAEMSYDSYGTDASLTVTGEGSLDVSGSSYGIWVKSGSGNASLTINGASVKANTTNTSSYYAGVHVMSSINATDPTLSLAVNGGSLTANGGANSDGIQFYVGSSDATDATTSMTVTDNAIVRAGNGIKASRVDKPTPSGTGIVFDGDTGTVYGDVTLDESLTINEGETLTIPQGSTLDTNGKLTNTSTITVQNGGTITDADTIANTGTINVENGGNLSGTPTGGTVVHAPGITTESLPNGTVGTPYTANLEATGDSIEWSATGLPAELQINAATGVISGTPATAGESTVIVTATNSAGEASKEYALAIEAVPVANVTLDRTVLALFPGDTTALTATVEPDTATDKTVTWESSDPNVATVDQSGKVTAVAPGTATITATAGGKTATCTVTVTPKTYTVSVNPTSLEFDTICPGDTQPAAKTVTITNTGNQTVEVSLPTATDYTITGDEGFTNDTASIEPEGTATFTVQPNDLTAGNHSETLTISWNNGNLSLPVGFTVGHELTGVAAKAPTCTEDGYEAYWKCERCGRYFSDADGKTPIPAPTVIKATGHQWGEPAWTWDGTTATATFTCAECGETRTVDATVTPTATTDPTCTGNGTTTYTATATLDGKDYTATKNITIPATGHDWGEPAWAWGEDGKTATATFTCKNDNSHTDIVTAAVTSAVTTDPTCTENGVTEYTATVEHNGTTYTATKNVADIPATGHQWGEDGHCTICDTIKPGFMPEIIQGDEATWTKGGGQPLSFTSNAAYADFQEARVDGQILDPVHYTVEQGSTIVTLKAAYLESLDLGEHTLDIVSSTGTATATFTITAKETQQPADTQQPAKPADTDRTPAKPAGDGSRLSRSGSDIMPAVATLAILMASGLALGTFVLRRSRR